VASWCAWLRRVASSRVARTNACSTNGARAKQTRGPSSPRQIALRPIGLAAYATAAVTPGSDDVANGRASRDAPTAPAGVAPAPPTEGARPAWPRRTVDSAAMSANAGVATWPAPIIDVRQDAVNADHAAPASGHARKLPTSGTRPKSNERDPARSRTPSAI